MYACGAYGLARNMQVNLATSFLIVLFSCFAVKSEDEYGAGEVSECTEGFASLYHIDAVEGNTAPREDDERQVVIPDINFTCSGTIRKWTLGAEWDGGRPAFTELQIWRRSSGSVYTKVGSTTIMVGSRNASQLYEYPLETPLAFQEGDILGYFQPEDDFSELALYIVESGTLRGYRMRVTALEPPTGPFDIDDAYVSNRHYPLIHVETDPPGCGCGFMTLERMYRLLGITPFSTGVRGSYSQQQLIFPDIRFTCSGVLMKWIMGGDWNDLGTNLYPDLQIWRPVGKNIYLRVHSTTISAAVERENNFYEFAVSPPIPFQPGDVLGVFQPWSGDSRLQVDYDSSGRSMNYFMTIERDQVEPSHSTITIDGALTTDATLPLVSVEIVVENQPNILHSSTTTPTMISASTTVTLPPVRTVCSNSTCVPPIKTPADVQDGDGGSDGVSIDSLSVGVGVAGASLVFITAAFIIITALVCLRKRNYALNTTKNVAYSSTSEIDSFTNMAYVAARDHHTAPNDEVYTYIYMPASNIPTFPNVAYMSSDVLTSTNQAYQPIQSQRSSHQ